METYLNSNIEIHKFMKVRLEIITLLYLNSNIEIHKFLGEKMAYIALYTNLNSNIEIHKSVIYKVPIKISHI